MDIGTLASKLNQAFPGAVLQKSRFGRSETLAVWVEMSAIARIAAFLKSDVDARLDFLENLSVAQFDDALVLTYFLSSTACGSKLILRGSIVPKTPEAAVSAPSVSDTWPMAAALEQEGEELFGVRFEGRPDLGSRLPADWKGFPLRKTYVFPQEYLGILHSRPTFSEGGHS